MLLRLLVPLLVLIAVGVGVYWLVSARAVLPVLSERLYPIRYKDDIARVADRYDLDPYLVAAVVRAESDYDPDAVSRAGAVGLMQLMPDTADWVIGLDTWKGARDPTLTDPRDNLELGACYLGYLIGRFSGDLVAALAAYNAGQGVVDGWLAAVSHDRLVTADIRFEETKDFVTRVERYRGLYKRVHPDAFASSKRAA